MRVRNAAVRPERYWAMRKAILRVLPRAAEGIKAAELIRRVRPVLSRELFPQTTTLGWYANLVKADLENKGLIERLPGAKLRTLSARRRARRS